MTEKENYLKTELYELMQKDEKTFDFLQKTSLDGVWYLDLEHPEYEWLSPEFWKTLGFNPGDKKHLASEWQELVYPEDLAPALENARKHCANPEYPYDQVIRYKHANGSTVWVRCRGFAIRDNTGKPIRMLGTHSDITSLMEIEQRNKEHLAQIDELYATTKLALEEINALFELSPDAMLQVDSTGRMIRANQAAVKLFGYSRDELLAMNVDSLVPSKLRHIHTAQRANYEDNPSIRPMGVMRQNIKALHKDGHEIPVEIRLSAIKTQHGKNTVAVIRDNTVTQIFVDKLYVQATTDPLTGLHNRRYFEAAAQEAFNNSKRHGNAMSLMIIDLDNFKKVNDQYGHDTGDLVLKTVTQCMRPHIREGEIIARLGGEEFAVLLPVADATAARPLGERIRERIEKQRISVEQGKGVLNVSVSIGISSRQDEDIDYQAILKRADQALYVAKARGKNQIILSPS